MSYPVSLTVEYPDRLSRGWLLLKVLFGYWYVYIPHGICLWIYEIGVGIVTFIAFWAILFTGKYPRGMFDFVAGYWRWSIRVSAYMSLLRDEYPPFSGEPEVGYPVALTVDYPDRLSRGWLLLKVFFGWLYVGIPHGIMLAIYGIGVAIITFIAFWAILFTGKYPEGMFDFVAGFWRWITRVNAYMGLLRDEYPPFSGKAE